MNEHFVGLKSCLPSSTSSNDKARIRIGHFEMGLSCVLWADFQPFSCVTSKKQMKEERPFPKRSHSAVRHKTSPVTRTTLKWPIPKKENKKRGETGRRKERGGGGEGRGGGLKRSYLVSFTTKQQPVRRSKSHSFRNRIPTTNAAVICLQIFITLLMHTKIHISPFEAN